MSIPKRTFSADVGQTSTGTRGPDAIENDLDSLIKCLDPAKEGLKEENFNALAHTINDSIADAYANQGTPNKLFSWLAKQVKTITGGATWSTAPPVTLTDVEDHINALAPHAGHDTNAKAYTDAHAESKATHGVGSGYYIAKTSRSDQLPSYADIQNKPESFAPSAHKSSHASGGTDALSPADIGAETPAGAQAKVDSHNQDKQVHGATPLVIMNSIVSRNSSGRAKVAAPIESDDIARKAEVDVVQGNLNTHLADHVRIELSEFAPFNPEINTWWYKDLGETADLGGGDGGLLLGNASTEEGDDV